MNARPVTFLTVLLVGLILAACGGGGGTGGGGAATPTAIPVATAVGAPTGSATTATIGTAGGSLSTPDGKIALTIPAGALAGDTAIGIQPLTNFAHGKIGAAFRLTPEGQTFLTPVTLTFAYTDQDLQGTAIEALGGAFQTAAGFWQWAGDATVDTTAKTVSVSSTHFSDWSLVQGIQIRPPSKTVKVNGMVNLEVRFCYSFDPQSMGYDCGDDEGLGTLTLNTVTDWSVNGVLGGSGATGTVSGIGAPATYTAPATKPTQNTVAVSARVDMGPRGTPLVVSNIKVVDELTVYEGTIFGRIDTQLDGQEQFVEMSANLRFTYNPDLSIGGAKWYDGTGTAFVRGRPFGCSEGSGTAPVQGANLQLFTEGPLAGTYQIGAGAIAMVTLTCGDPPAALTVPLAAGANAGGSDICTSLPVGADPAHLAGSWSCNVAGGSTAHTNWTLNAVD